MTAEKKTETLIHDSGPVVSLIPSLSAASPPHSFMYPIPVLPFPADFLLSFLPCSTATLLPDPHICLYVHFDLIPADVH